MEQGYSVLISVDMDGNIKSSMVKAALSAGEIHEKYYGKKLQLEKKEGKGIVSQMDKEAEDIILSVLLKDYKFSVIAEESGNVINNQEYCWIIDPLDGTTNYTRQIPFFCVSIVLYKNNEPDAAIIYQSLVKELFYAKRPLY